MGHILLFILVGITLWFILKSVIVLMATKSFDRFSSEKIWKLLLGYFKTKSDVKIFISYLSAMVAIAGYGPTFICFAIEILFKENYVGFTAIIKNNLGLETLILGLLITLSFGFFLYYRYKRDVISSSENILTTTTQILEGQKLIESKFTAGLDDIKKLISDKSESKTLSSIVLELEKSISSLKVKTALNLLGKIEAIIKNESPDKKLMSLIFYNKAQCQRHINGENYKQTFHESYSLMKECNDYNIDIVGGKIMTLLLEKDIDSANVLAFELRSKNKYSVWGWIPELLRTDNPQDLYKLLPNELKLNDKILGEILMLNSDIPFSKGLITDNYVYAPLGNITNDNLCIWALHLSISLNKLLHNWSFDSASTINLPQQNKYINEYYDISKRYIALLEKTECDNLLPDVNFIHDFCAFTQNNDRIYLEQIEKHLPSENFKEVYALMKINMMSVLKLNKEAIEYIDGLSQITCDIVNIRLRLSMELVDVKSIKESYQLAIDKNIVFPIYRFGYFIPALKLYSKEVSPLATKIKFESTYDENAYHLIAKHYSGEKIDVSALKDTEKGVCPLLKILIADVYKEIGNIEDALVIGKESLEGNIFDFRSYIYIDILKSSERSSSELYHYLKSLRENGFINNDSWLADEANLAVAMSDYENALAPIELLYSRYPNNHNILEKYLIVLDKIESYEKIKEVTEGIDLKSIEPEYCTNIFNVLIRNGFTERAVSFLFNSIQQSNDQSLRALYYSAALNDKIGKIIMHQPNVISSGDYVLLEQNNQEIYETILQGSRLDILIGCSVDSEIKVPLFNGDECYKVKSIFTKYFKLFREVSTDAHNNRFREFTCFTLDDIQGEDGDILSNLEKITSSISGFTRQDRENRLTEYKQGKLPLGLLVNNNELVGGMYEKLFGSFYVYVPLSAMIQKKVQDSNFDLKDVDYVLDLSSLLMIEEIDKHFHLDLDKKFIIPRGLYQLIKDTLKREQAGLYTFVSDLIFKQLYIADSKKGEVPFQSKLRQLISWVDDNCKILTAESKVNITGHTNHLEMNYMDIELESMLLAMQPKRLLLSEDLGLIEMMSRTIPIMNIEPWARILLPTLCNDITSYLAKHYYVGLHLSSDDIFDICISSNQETNDLLEHTIAINPLIWENLMNAINAIANNSKIINGDIISINALISLFRYFEPQICLHMSTASLLKYNNIKMRNCIIKALNNVYPGIVQQ